MIQYHRILIHLTTSHDNETHEDSRDRKATSCDVDRYHNDLHHNNSSNQWSHRSEWDSRRKQIGSGIIHITTTKEILIATVAIRINSFDPIKEGITITTIYPDMLIHVLDLIMITSLATITRLMIMVTNSMSKR